MERRGGSNLRAAGPPARTEIPAAALSAPDGDDVLDQVQCLQACEDTAEERRHSHGDEEAIKTFGAAVGQFRAATEYVSVTLSVRLLPFFFSMNDPSRA